MKRFYKLTFILVLLFQATINVNAQQAMSVRTGATFQWAGPQPTPASPTVLTSITINGLNYSELVVPDGYEMTQLGPNGHAPNAIRTNGSVTVSNSGSPTWNANALAAFQNFNLNQYFQSSQNGLNICGDSVAYSTTLAQKQSLLYSQGILSTPGAVVAVVERNANNCFYVELTGTPAGGGPDQVLGGTFVRNGSTIYGANFAPPATNVDYWESGRTNDNTNAAGEGATIGIALFYLSDIAPLNSVVKKVTLTASTFDHGDGKFFVASIVSDLGINKVIDNNAPTIGSNVTFTLTADNGTAPEIYADTAAVVKDILPSGFTYVSSTTSQGTYNSADGTWDIGTLIPGQSETLTITATVNPTGSYVNTTSIAGVLYDTDLSNNNDTAIAYPILPDPDINATFVNVPVTGDVSTNDESFPPGTTYGMPTADPGNPTTAMPTMNPDGTYTFVTPVAGVYEFLVPVCPPGVVMPGCPESLLTITVLDESANNPPVANTDIASTESGTPVTLSTLDNDAAGSIDDELDPSSVSVVDSPSNGTVTVDPLTGDITYTPDPSFVGTDTLEYEVCDDQTPAQCETALQIITVVGDDAPNTTAAADDFAYTPLNTPVSANVSDNDTDPQDDNQTVTAQTTTIPGKGTLVLGTDGSYTFTPVNGFTGPVEFPYTTCDDGTPQACAEATLHILVSTNAPLAVDHVYFFGKTINGENQLQWETINEYNNQYFELYHGTQISGLEKLATIESKGAFNTNGNWHYTFNHTKPVVGKNNYYQLHSVDYNLKSKAHSVINLYVGEEGSVVVYPNPANDVLTLSINNLDIDDLKIELYDLQGRIILSSNHVLDNGSFNTTISLENVVSGMYILKVSDLNSKLYTFPIRKK